jgi:hypothetical protein
MFFLNSVYVVYGIALNSAELRGITYYGIRRIPRNFAEFHDFWCNEIPHNFNFSGLIFLRWFYLLNNSAHTTFEGIRNLVYTSLNRIPWNSRGIPLHIPFLLYFYLFFHTWIFIWRYTEFRICTYGIPRNFAVLYSKNFAELRITFRIPRSSKKALPKTPYRRLTAESPHELALRL